ncbi:DUF3977 family protein [Paenibacillus tianjinensis]|uniref:DUF3977 family protein n=1 Tax=Paenibacillus tianjinensis TaxID=2810347 RepID=A0ABX7LIB2_9BACL|nr:DUF3977 family protein [Paenibacillus tianjinensis]QSF47751.1 DUF3977 family protein [Paenibacillus tianjinensis]
MKYIEFGIGNRWFVRTETELADGTEFEVKGVAGPIRVHSLYIRCWVGTTVWVFNVRSGFKKIRKGRKTFKLLFGVCSYLDE